jgi:hypothetical protein
MANDDQVLFIPSAPDLTVVCTIKDAIQGSPGGVADGLSETACCQVEIHLRRIQNKCLMYSLDCHGIRKTNGGDEFYIRYEERAFSACETQEEQPASPSLQSVALITDKGDGSYELDFSTTPMFPEIPCTRCGDITNPKTVISIWTVYFEYTNRIGALPPPSKRSWKNGGYTHTKYQITGDPSIIRPPHIREIRRPTPPAVIDLSAFDQVFAFGDSTFCQFMRQRPNKKGKYYFQPNLCVLGEKVRLGLNSRTVSELLQLLEESNIEGVLTKPVDGGAKRALIVGSCLWDVLDSEDDLQGCRYDDHAQACTEYIQELRQRYPDVVIVWKSPMACHSKSEILFCHIDSTFHSNLFLFRCSPLGRFGEGGRT